MRKFFYFRVVSHHRTGILHDIEEFGIEFLKVADDFQSAMKDGRALSRPSRTGSGGLGVSLSELVGESAECITRRRCPEKVGNEARFTMEGLVVPIQNIRHDVWLILGENIHGHYGHPHFLGDFPDTARAFEEFQQFHLLYR